MEPLKAAQESGAGILGDSGAAIPFASAPDLKACNSVGVTPRAVRMSEKGLQNCLSNPVDMIALPAIGNSGQDRERGCASG
jgi:hypothetical protein